MAATGVRDGETRLMMLVALYRPSALPSAFWVKSTPPRMDVPACKATAVNSFINSCCNSWLTMASLDISPVTASTSSSSRCFRISAALSSPSTINKAASFCGLVMRP